MPANKLDTSTALPSEDSARTVTHTNQEDKKKKQKQNRRLHYDEVRESNKVFWRRDENGNHIMSRTQRPDTKRLVEYDSFGFFGPEHQNQPTIVATGTGTPLIVVSPPIEQCDLQHTEFLLSERARYLKAKLWLKERQKRENSDLYFVERQELLVPPLQIAEKARTSNTQDNEERRKKRAQSVLKKETIDSLEKGPGGRNHEE